MLETSRNPPGSATAILILHGQCYDGCSTMAATRGGVAAKGCVKLNPWQCFTHCYDNALNLCVNDTMKGSAAMKDCLKTCFVGSCGWLLLVAVTGFCCITFVMRQNNMASIYIYSAFSSVRLA